MVINRLKHGNKLTNESIALGIDGLSLRCHLLFEDFHQRAIRLLFGFQQGISLCQGLVVATQQLYIRMIQLRDNHVQKTTTTVTSAINQGGIRRRNKDERNQSNVLRQAFVFFLVAFKTLSRASFHATIDAFFISHVIEVQAVEHKEVAIMRDNL